MDAIHEVVIIGGGLAGLTAGIHLSKMGIATTIIEKNKYPKHKVCGEYISNEVLPYFNELGLNINDLNPSKIEQLEFSTSKGLTIKKKLPLGGFGISRYALDYYLYLKALENGCSILESEVTDLNFNNDCFDISTVTGRKIKTKICLGAFGKRSQLDIKLNRKFISKKSPYLAVKAHYSGVYNSGVVGLHNFNGGYCGVSKVEDHRINICYLADYKSFKKYKNIAEYQEKIVQQNPNLKAIFEQSSLLFEKPLTISQISFESKSSLENHVLMMGDTAGLIHPLCGNGMAIAIHSAKIASDLVIAFINGTISRADLEKKYQKEWNLNFKSRMRMGRILSQIFQYAIVSDLLLRILIQFPALLSIIISNTHGKPIKSNL